MRPPRSAARFGTTHPGSLQSGDVHSWADVAQLAEHITRNDGVLGSIPSVGSKDTFHGTIPLSGRTSRRVGLTTIRATVVETGVGRRLPRSIGIGYARYGVDSR